MRLLGLDLGEREIRVARGELLLGTLRLTALERIPFDTPDVLSASLAQLAGRRPPTVLTALPAASVTHRTLVLPFRNRRRLARTIPLELAGHLAVGPANDLIAFAPLGETGDGTAVLAALARQAEVAAHVALLAGAGLPPARIDLAPLPVWNLVPPELGDVALILADGGRSAVSLRRAGRLAGLRALGASAGDARSFVAEVRWSLVALGPAPPTVLVAGADADSALTAALATTFRVRVVPLAEVATVAAPPDGNLAACAVAAGLIAGAARRAPVGLAFPSGEHPTRAPLGRTAALAAAVLGLALVDLGLVRHDLARREAMLARAIHAEASAALPGRALVAPRAELEAAASTRARRQARLGDGALAALRELSAHVPATLSLDLDELAVEPDAVRLHGRADSFEAVDTLRRALAASPLLSEVAADETRTAVDGRQVEFRLRALRRSAGGGATS